MPLTVGAKVRLPMEASSTSIAAPATTSPFCTMASFAPKGAARGQGKQDEGDERGRRKAEQRADAPAEQWNDHNVGGKREQEQRDVGGHSAVRKRWPPGRPRTSWKRARVASQLHHAETPEWERQAAAVVYAHVRDFIKISEGHTAKPTCEQRGRFMATCWTAQMYKHFEDPKPGYVADWADLTEWRSRRPTPTSHE
jgi:hypothetical protein